MFNLYDDDYESVQSDEDGGLGADVTVALDILLLRTSGVEKFLLLLTGEKNH